MRSIFNKLAYYSRTLDVLKSIFRTAQTGLDMEVALSSSTLLTDKLIHLRKCMDREDQDVHLWLAQAAYTLGCAQRMSAGETDPWKVVFKSLARGADLTRILLHEDPTIPLPEKQEKLASLGRIEYQTQICHSWYLSQDPRMKPVFQSLARLHDQDKLLLAFFPKGQHVIGINGQPYPFEIK